MRAFMKCFLTLFVLCLQIALSSKLAADPVVAGYYENWSQYRPATGGRATFFPNLIDPSIMTDIYFAFAYFGFVTKSIDPDNPHLTGDYTVQPVEWNDQSVLYPQIQALKQINPSLRTHLSIGGWGFNDPNDPNGAGQFTYKLFSEMAASSSAREQFINSAIDYAHQYGFDGIDLDWEYPGDLSRGGTDDDFANFVELLKELQSACKSANPPLIVSYASAAIVPTGVSQKYHDNPSLYFQWLAECSLYLDHVNVMCYDYHGAFDSPKLTGVNAPLNHDTDPNSTMYIAKTIENYLSGGVPANKIVMGMPTYGHSFGGVTGMSDEDYAPGKPFTSAGAAGPSTGSPGLLAYFEISDMIANKELTFGTDSTTSTAIAYNTATGEWVSFDTPDTIALKTDLVKEKGLLGAMFWAIDDDEYQWGDKYPNIRKAYDMLYPSENDLGMSLESLKEHSTSFSSKSPSRSVKLQSSKSDDLLLNSSFKDSVSSSSSSSSNSSVSVNSARSSQVSANDSESISLSDDSTRNESLNVSNGSSMSLSSNSNSNSSSKSTACCKSSSFKSRAKRSKRQSRLKSVLSSKSLSRSKDKSQSKSVSSQSPCDACIKHQTCTCKSFRGDTNQKMCESSKSKCSKGFLDNDVNGVAVSTNAEITPEEVFYQTIAKEVSSFLESKGVSHQMQDEEGLIFKEDMKEDMLDLSEASEVSSSFDLDESLDLDGVEVSLSSDEMDEDNLDSSSSIDEINQSGLFEQKLHSQSHIS